MKKIKNIGKVLTKEEQKAIKGGNFSCSNGPCTINGVFWGYCVNIGNGDPICACSFSSLPCTNS
jgi:hypothetical protein